MFKNFNWGHGIAIALGCFMLFILSLIYMYQSQDNSFDLVTEEYYEEEISFQDQIDAQNRLNKLANQPKIIVNSIGILIQFPEELKESTGKILLRHPSQKEKDIAMDLNLNSNNEQIIPALKLHKATYLLRLNWITNKQFYRKDFETKWK